MDRPAARGWSSRRVQPPGTGESGTAGPGSGRGSPCPGIGRLPPGFRRGSGLAGAECGTWPPDVGAADAELADTGPGGPELAGPELAGPELAGAGLAVRSARPRDIGLANGRTRALFPMRSSPRADAQVRHPSRTVEHIRSALSAKCRIVTDVSQCQNMPLRIDIYKMLALMTQPQEYQPSTLYVPLIPIPRGPAADASLP